MPVRTSGLVRGYDPCQVSPCQMTSEPAGASIGTAASTASLLSGCRNCRWLPELRDVDGTPITDTEGRAIVAERYQIPNDIRRARRSTSKVRSATRRDERVKNGVARRSETALVPPAA